MELIRTTPTHEIWQGEFEGKAVQFLKNVFTNEISVNAHDFALCMGYKSLDDMMMDDNVLDACIEVKQETGIFPIIKQNF